MKLPGPLAPSGSIAPQLVRACQGLYDVCSAYGVPLISGKDSMKNESMMGGVKICVPPTLLLSAIGQIDDVRNAVTLDFKEAGDVIFILGITGAHTGGSEYLRYLGDRAGLEAEIGQPSPYVGSNPPTLDPASTLPLYRVLSRAIADGLVRSAATPSKGGLGVTLAKCAMGGDLGATLDLSGCAGATELEDDVLLFSESNSRFVTAVADADAEEFSKRFADLACRQVGVVTGGDRLTIRRGDDTLVDTSIDEMRRRFKEGLADA